MREILFRGKQKDTKEWVYGNLFHLLGNSYICYGTINYIPDLIEVMPETVGEYTGLTDKNGRKIFEGDLVRVDGVETVFVIVYVDGVFRIAERIRNTNFYSNSIHNCYLEMSVIGNTYDNPELLEGGNENA